MFNYFCFVLFFFACNLLQAQKLIHLSGEAQGTTYHISYYDSLNRNFFGEIERLLHDYDQSVSTYQRHSLISQVNRNDTSVILDAYFYTCFAKAKEVWKNTKGCFDPTVFPLVNAWGFGPEKKQIVKKETIDSILPFVGFELIEISDGKISKKDNRVGLDFNAFAQGYSVDVVSDFLMSKNITSFIVEIGGEVYAKGKKPNNEFWKIGIEQPHDNSTGTNPLKSIVKLENIAVATSGNYRRFFIENGQKYVHHIDPSTGYPTKNNLLSASVFSSECVYSDAYATGLLVMGLKKAKRFLKKHKELKAYLIYSDKKGNYKVYQSPGLEKIIEEVMR
jgi:FAD:protein FMN transferase